MLRLEKQLRRRLTLVRLLLRCVPGLPWLTPHLVTFVTRLPLGPLPVKWLGTSRHSVLEVLKFPRL